MEIAGVHKITLYENLGIEYIFPDISVVDEITEVTTTGTTDILDFCVDVKFMREIAKGLNNKQLKKDTIEFYIQDFSEENEAIIKRLQQNRTGSIAKIEFQSEETLILPTPLFFNKTMKESEKNSFILSANYRVQSLETDLILL